VVRFLSGILDNSSSCCRHRGAPRPCSASIVPGFGIVLSILVLLLTGVLVRNLFGEKIVESVESLIRRRARGRAGVRRGQDFSETVLTDKGTSFKQVVMVEFPRRVRGASAS